MSKLSDLVDIIGQKNKVHICIHDISGILSFEHLQIDFSNRTHSTRYCNTAKSTSVGYRLCIKCKKLANEKAINEQKPFFGYCPFGLFEAVYPVIIDSHVLCIVYAGNAITDKNLHSLKLSRTCRALNINKKGIFSVTDSCETESNQEALIKTAKVIADYIKLIITENGYQRHIKRNSCGWVIDSICEYIENNFRDKLTLKNLAKLYFMNEKYLGRLFKTETGKSFNEYLNEVRLEKALDMLYGTNKPIIEIALDCGYSSVNYFNRLCLEKYSMPPSKLRIKNRL